VFLSLRRVSLPTELPPLPGKKIELKKLVQFGALTVQHLVKSKVCQIVNPADDILEDI